MSFLAVAGGLAAAEGVARWYVGLGDPPLSVADPHVEYRFRPGEYTRFGNRVHINAHSMRSDVMPPSKPQPDEVRVLVLGDSVVNGGAQTDQGELATSILQRELGEALGRPVVVGNVSAGSWGPGNLLAYVRKFGVFDADAAVIVLSSHDAADNPTFEPIVGVDPNFPDASPWLALEEAVVRYLPRYLPNFGADPGNDSQARAVAAEPTEEAMARGLADLRALVAELEARGVPRDRILIAQHLERTELGDAPNKVGHERISAAAEAMGVAVLQLGEAFERAGRGGQSLYRDNIHPNAAGQAVMAEVLRGPILAKLQAPPEGVAE